MDDAELIRRYVENGSEAAFSELVSRHLSLVHSAAMRQVGGDFHRARDITQMVFTLLARKAASLTHHTALTGWLYSTTHFEASTLIRGERRRKLREEESYHMNELLANPEPEVDWSLLGPIFDGAMHELNEGDREAILWRFFDAQPLAVIGERLGLNASAAQKRVDRALDRMRASLAKRGANSTTAALTLMLTEHVMVAAPAGLAETVTATALASAAGAGSSASHFFKFLGKSKLAVGVPGALWIGVILGVPTIGVAYEIWSDRSEHAALAADQEGYEVQLEHFWALKRSANGSPLAGGPAARAGKAIRDPQADFQRFATAYPRARAMLITQQQDLVRRMYGSFFRSAGLAPSQIGQFEEAMIEIWMRQMTITPHTFAIAGTVVPTPGADQMRAILGDQAYQQFQNYNQTAYANLWAYRVATYCTEAAISADQVERLAQIMAKNNLASPGNDGMEFLVSTDWDAVLTQAKTLFSPSQWKAVEPVLIDQQAKGGIAKARQSP